METRITLTGDVNLMGVTDPDLPFRRVGLHLRESDLVFANLECCLHRPPHGHSSHNEGFFVAPDIGRRALMAANIRAVGLANNVNYGEQAILGSIAELDAAGIAHTGAGSDLRSAREPAVVTCNGVRCGFLQRTSVYWPTHHEARADAAGVAVIRGETAYHLPLHKTRSEVPPMNRPGLPPVIKTWADPHYLRAFADDIAALRPRVDVLIASCHWGLWEEVLEYMTEIAHAAVDAGADVVMGHGPHYALPVECYRGKPIFYGLGSFAFHTGHGGRLHDTWLGMTAQLRLDQRSTASVALRLVRPNASSETEWRSPAGEHEAFEALQRRSGLLGARLSVNGEEAKVEAL